MLIRELLPTVIACVGISHLIEQVKRKPEALICDQTVIRIIYIMIIRCLFRNDLTTLKQLSSFVSLENKMCIHLKDPLIHTYSDARQRRLYQVKCLSSGLISFAQCSLTKRQESRKTADSNSYKQYPSKNTELSLRLFQTLG